MTAVLQLERPYTVEDLTNTPDDGRRYEVIGGELVVSPAPSTKHQRVSFRLSRILGDYLERVGSGEAFAAPIDVVLGTHDIVQPDLVVILHRHADRLTDAGIEGAPDIVIEINPRPPASEWIGYERARPMRRSAFRNTGSSIRIPRRSSCKHLSDGRYPSSENARRQRPISAASRSGHRSQGCICACSAARRIRRQHG